MADLVRIVDSIAASPTVLLDLNDETSWWTRSLKAPPPRLRRSVAQNAMSDGDHTAASTYGSRIVELVLESRESTQDDAAAQMQVLFRLLDAADGKFLQYQPQGASKPVFFVLERSDLSDLSDVMAQAAMRSFTVELKAESFALGLMETLGPYTVSNDPAAVSNPGYVDLPTVLGDVPTHVVYWDNPSNVDHRNRLVSTHSGSNAASTVTALQCESMAKLTDTTNPGGGPDAAMSGTGVNNFSRTTFGTATISMRLQETSVTQPGGSYRLIAAVRRSSATGTIGLRARVIDLATSWTTWQGEVCATSETTNRHLVDLGIATWPPVSRVGNSDVSGLCTASLELDAERTSGTSTLDWDCIFLVPAGGQLDAKAGAHMLTASDEFMLGSTAILDGANDQAILSSSASDPTSVAGSRLTLPASGSFPLVAPGVANRVHVLSWWQGSALSGPDADVTSTVTVSLAYWPKYLFVRPTGS